MKPFKEKREEKTQKPAKLHKCGHVEKAPGSGHVNYVRCETLTSKSIKLPNGQQIHICESHRRHHEGK